MLNIHRILKIEPRHSLRFFMPQPHTSRGELFAPKVVLITKFMLGFDRRVIKFFQVSSRKSRYLTTNPYNDIISLRVNAAGLNFLATFPNFLKKHVKWRSETPINLEVGHG